MHTDRPQKKMEGMKLRDSFSPIYVIFRVYHLGQRNMTAEVYLDPAMLADQGRLRFSADTYIVVPGYGIN